MVGIDKHSAGIFRDRSRGDRKALLDEETSEQGRRNV
jgi:hypothetical protein